MSLYRNGAEQHKVTLDASRSRAFVFLKTRFATAVSGQSSICGQRACLLSIQSPLSAHRER